jgi:hypothetical protein
MGGETGGTLISSARRVNSVHAATPNESTLTKFNYCLARTHGRPATNEQKHAHTRTKNDSFVGFLLTILTFRDNFLGGSKVGGFGLSGHDVQFGGRRA